MIHKYIGLDDEDLDGFRHETLVERVARHGTILKRLEKVQREQPKSPAHQEKFSATIEQLQKLRGEHSTLSQKQDQLTAAFQRLEKIQDAQSRSSEKYDITSIAEQIQAFRGDQATSSGELKRLSVRQDTQESQITELENKNLSASSQIDQARAAQMNELRDAVQALIPRIAHLEQQPQNNDDRASVLQIKRINADIQALMPRMAHLEQQSKSTDDQASASRVAEVKEEVRALVTIVSRLEQMPSLHDELSEKVMTLTARIDQFGQHFQRTSPNAIASGTSISPQTQIQHNGAEVSDLHEQIRYLNARMKRAEGNVQDLSDEAIHDRNKLAGEIQTVIQPTGDFLKRDLARYGVMFDECNEKVNMIQEGLVNVLSRPDLGPLEEAVKHLQADLEQVQTVRANEAALREQELLDIKNHLEEKAATEVVEAQLNSLRTVFRGFQDQYNNITTDDLYSKMINWFMQNYPSNPPQVLQQLAAVQHDIRGLQNTLGGTAWLQSKMQDLNSLLEMGPQLAALVQSAGGIQHLLQNAGNLVAATRAADEANKRADKMEIVLGKDGVNLQSTQTAVRELQQAVQDQHSDSASLVRRPEVLRMIEDLENLMKNKYAPTSNRHDVAAQTSVKKLIDRIQSLENSSSLEPSDLQQQVDHLKVYIREHTAAQDIVYEMARAIGVLQSLCLRNGESFEAVFSQDFRPAQPTTQPATSNSGGAKKG